MDDERGGETVSFDQKLKGYRLGIRHRGVKQHAILVITLHLATQRLVPRPMSFKSGQCRQRKDGGG